MIVKKSDFTEEAQKLGIWEALSLLTDVVNSVDSDTLEIGYSNEPCTCKTTKTIERAPDICICDNCGERWYDKS